jgi:Trypsin-like peptidase domain
MNNINSLTLIFNKIVTNIYAKIIISLLIACIISQSIIVFTHKDAELVKSTAKKFTVLIRVEYKKDEHKNDEYVNGVIYKSDRGKYSILTVSHIFTSLLEDKDSINKIQVVTNDKKKYDLNIERMKIDESLDIAVVSFKSTDYYSEIKLGKDPVVGQFSYIFGYKECTNSTIKVHDHIEFNTGKIDGISSNVNGTNDGYDIKYNNATISGMSGSPILDYQGNLIAIHGSSIKVRDGWKNWSENECKRLDDDFKGDSYGISVSKFRKYI